MNTSAQSLIQALAEPHPELTLAPLGELAVDPSTHLTAQPHLSAACGVARVKGRLFITADRLFQLGMVDDDKPEDMVSIVKLFDGTPPPGRGGRKLSAPEFDTLAALPAMPGCPYGALLALPSGVNVRRETALLIVLDAQGMPTERLAYIDMGPIYEPLRQRFDDLNIESAFYASGDLRLLHQGRRGDARNACIVFDMTKIGPWLTGQSLLPPAVKAVHKVPLGNLAGLPLGLTDGSALPGGAWAFCAVAVNPRNSPDAGVCVGSVVGVIGADGSLWQMETLQGAPNVQGIIAQVGDGEREGEAVLTLLIAATDAQQPATLAQTALTLI